MCLTKFKETSDLAEYLVLKTMASALFDPTVIKIMHNYTDMAEDFLDMDEIERTELHHEILSVRANLVNELNKRSSKLIDEED